MEDDAPRVAPAPAAPAAAADDEEDFAAAAVAAALSSCCRKKEPKGTRQRIKYRRCGNGREGAGEREIVFGSGRLFTRRETIERWYSRGGLAGRARS